MTDVPALEPTVLVIFGAAGDLAWRKLVPALFSLSVEGRLPERFAVLGVDRRPIDDAAFAERCRDGVSRFSRGWRTGQDQWTKFASRLRYTIGELDDPKLYAELVRKIASLEESWRSSSTRIFYFAIPPLLIAPVVRGLGATDLARDRQRTRFVVEKPFGHDLASARALDRVVSELFEERQVFRIDHYLGKETVQNILALRFGNALFEPLWNQRYIDHVQISVSEMLGVEHRGAYYETAGALRDMVQSHLLQLLCLVAMEPPLSFEAQEIRNKKVDLLHAVRPMMPAEVDDCAARGQYGKGRILGAEVPGYRDEPAVAQGSRVETYAALKLNVDNWRWQGVPFYLRTGKRLAVTASEICIQFRPVPHLAFPASATQDLLPNRLVLRIQPCEGIALRIQAKRPGPTMRLGGVDLSFSYRDAFAVELTDAYETLLLDAMRGDGTLFMRADQVEAAWSLMMPILDQWRDQPPDFPNYAAGSWGPASADALIERDGRRWFAPEVSAEVAGKTYL